MAVAPGNSQAEMAKHLRDMADKVDAGMLEIQNIVITNEPYEYPSEYGYQTWIPGPFSSMDITFRPLRAQGSRSVNSPMKQLEPLKHPMFGCQTESGERLTAAQFNQLLGDSITANTLTIDTAEHPMLNSDPSLGEYIKRVLVELGFRGEYKSHKMVPRPGKAPLLELEGVV